MSAPTEEEIRAAIEVSADKRQADIGQLICAYTAPLEWEPSELRGPAYGGCLWDNLRPTEAERLSAHLETVYESLDGPIERMIREAIVSAALAFAAECPDAPRATREAVTA